MDVMYLLIFLVVLRSVLHLKNSCMTALSRMIIRIYIYLVAKNMSL